MEQPLIRGVAPQMRDQAAYLTLGGGAGGRSLGSIYLNAEFGWRVLNTRSTKLNSRYAQR